MSKKHPLRPYIPAIIGGAFLLLVISVIVHYISNKSENAPKKKERKMPPVHVELKPPPPPPPPPKVEKQPEPKAEKLKENKPEPKPDAQPKNNDAKPESVGSGKGGMQTDLGGGDVSRPAGQIGGNGNSTDEADKKRQAEFYGRQVARELENFFADDEELLSKEFRVTAKLWFERNGNIQRFDIVKASDDNEINQEMQNKLGKFRNSEVPPEGMTSAVVEFTVRI